MDKYLPDWTMFIFIMLIHRGINIHLSQEFDFLRAKLAICEASFGASMLLLTLYSVLAQAACPLQEKTSAEIQSLKATELSTIFEQAKGCTTLVEIWASWCGPCVSLAPHMVEFHQANPDILMLSVSVDNSYGAMKQFVKTHQPPGQLIHLNPWTMADLKNAFMPLGLTFPERIPYLVLLDEEGAVQHSLTEPADLKALQLTPISGPSDVP